MSGYVAPLRDMRFVLDALCDIDGIAGLPGHGDVTLDVIDQVLAEAGRLSSERWAPLDRPGDRAGAVMENGTVRLPDGFKEAYEAFAAGGWNGVAAPAEHGGMGLPCCVAHAVQEMWQSANMALALCPMLTQAGIELLSRHGSVSQRERYLPRLVSGTWTGTMEMTEPQAGSDLGAIRTRAVRDGDRYRITGQKIFITYGDHDLSENIIHTVLARTPDAPPGTRGLSLFLVPKVLVDADGTLGARNDLRCVSLEHKLGLHACPTGVMAYGDSGGAIGELVGAENDGLALMFTMMNNARLGVGLQGVAVAERAYQRAAAYARARVQSRLPGGAAPVPIIQHPDVRRMLMTMRAHVEAARALVYSTAAMMDVARSHRDAAERNRAAARVDLLTPIAKAWCTDIGVDMASLGIQVHGGMGYIEESGAAQVLRDARITTIYEGTNGIQANDLVGRKLLRDGGAAMRELIDDIAYTAADAGNAALRDGAGALKRASEWVVQTGATAEVYAGAVPLLGLAGTVIGGWLMARSAAAAARRLRDNPADAAFLSAKQATCRFYAEHILSRAPALAAPITAGAGSVLALAPDQY
jgi:alkylation response protein AidB-like acyl-CoA dehydrogenase